MNFNIIRLFCVLRYFSVASAVSFGFAFAIAFGLLSPKAFLRAASVSPRLRGYLLVLRVAPWPKCM